MIFFDQKKESDEYTELESNYTLVVVPEAVGYRSVYFYRIANGKRMVHTGRDVEELYFNKRIQAIYRGAMCLEVGSCLSETIEWIPRRTGLPIFIVDPFSPDSMITLLEYALREKNYPAPITQRMATFISRAELYLMQKDMAWFNMPIQRIAEEYPKFERIFDFVLDHTGGLHYASQHDLGIGDIERHERRLLKPNGFYLVNDPNVLELRGHQLQADGVRVLGQNEQQHV